MRELIDEIDDSYCNGLTGEHHTVSLQVTVEPDNYRVDYYCVCAVVWLYF